MLMVSDLVDLARDRRAAGRRAAHFARAPRGIAGPKVVVLAVCRHCNMSCPHCYASASRRRSPQDLDREEILRILGELRAAGVDDVVFSGGEPLLRDDLHLFVRRARDLGMRPHLSTNGVFLEARAAKLAASGLAYAGVSLDAPGSKNDEYRGLRGGFDLALRGIRAARALGIKTGIRMTLTRSNASELRAMLEVARVVEVDRFYVSHLVYSGRAVLLAAGDLTPPESRALLLELFDLALGQSRAGQGPRIVTGGNDSAGPLFVEWTARRLGPARARLVRGALAVRGGNSAGEAIVAIDHRGRVHPDQFWQSVVLGDLRVQSFQEALAHPLRRLLAGRSARLAGRCGRCRWLDVCRGSHRERALARWRDMWAPDPSCVMTEEEVVPEDLGAGAAQ